MTRRIRVGVLFGGRSGEHEVSIASARSLVDALDPDRYETVPIGITREGHWLIGDSPNQFLASEVTLELPDTAEAVPDVTHHGIVRVNERGGIDLHQTAVDVVFPLLHGPYGEDGTVQGLLELADIPYVGSGVLGSAVSMDKLMMKAVLEHAGLPGVAYAAALSRDVERDVDGVVAKIEECLTYPVFVKPCNLGSSVGISKAGDRAALRHSLLLAARYDRRIIVEQGVDAREIECSVLGNDTPLVSVPGEVVPRNEFYDYDAKYTEGHADLIIPAELSADQTREVRDLALHAFAAVDAAGLARVDFFIRRDDGTVLLNEINTMPGFTSTSMYPKLWEATGVPYHEIADRLIELALERHAERSRRSVR
ncbi:MAG TPA: D-alanine--D-alanine ligase [Chloroflexota bacterium]|nr:D-alanine--D-alanine ligase [Chloroflexota bacterium]